LTRLKKNDICKISSGLRDYDRKLQLATGHGLLEIALHAQSIHHITHHITHPGTEPIPDPIKVQDTSQIKDQIQNRIGEFSIHVVPITAGQGIITDFSQTVSAILKFLGFDAKVTLESDTSGIASAYDNRADAIMMADDNRFVGINLHTRKVVDNSEVTGRIFATALGLMAGGIRGKSVLVMGCGPVGESGAITLLNMGAAVGLFDTHASAAIALQKKLSKKLKNPRVQIVTDFPTSASKFTHILEATPSINTIPDELICDHMMLSAPGVPLGISKNGCNRMKNRLVHDNLELGVAGMAIDLVLNPILNPIL
jgi:pyrrolysine biosynthesis protein PylD